MTENTANSSIFTHFSTIKDPRVNRCKKHKLIDILFMTLSAVICGADNWVAIEAFCKAKKALRHVILLAQSVQIGLKRYRLQLEHIGALRISCTGH